MNEVLKRLEIIKNSISIEDEEIIELQVMKLEKMDIDEDIKKIVLFLKKGEYYKALSYIEEYLKRYSSLTLYMDLEVQGLKLELKSLEAKLQKLIEEKTEILNTIREFSKEYALRVGDLIEDILKLKEEILYKKQLLKEKIKKKYQKKKKVYEKSKRTLKKIEENMKELEEVLEELDEDSPEYEEYSQIYENFKEVHSELEEELEKEEEELKKMEKEIEENENVEEEYEEAKSAYEEYHQEYEEVKEEQQNIDTLSDEEKKELKRLYRKAAKLCHPDIVADEYKQKAQEIMKEVNEAYNKQDLEKIKMILNHLENGSLFQPSSEVVNDVEILKTKISEIKMKIDKIKSEIEAIKNDETYLLISEIDDWDRYFEELKEKLQEEKERLEEEAKRISLEDNEGLLEIPCQFRLK